MIGIFCAWKILLPNKPIAKNSQNLYDNLMTHPFCVPVGTQPKRQGPSRIQAQRRAIWSAEPLSPVSTQPKRQNPSKIQAKRVAIWSAEPVPFGTFEPAKSKDGWGCEGLAAPLGPSIEWNHSTGGHAAETAEPQQDSGQTGCHLVGRAGAVWHLRTR